MSSLPQSEHNENARILTKNNYLESKEAFNNYVNCLLGYCPAEVAVQASVSTQWYNFCMLPQDDILLDTHPTLPGEITCVFQLFDWEAISQRIGKGKSLVLIDPFAGIDSNILTHMDFLLSEHQPQLREFVKFISNDKKISGVDSLNPSENEHLRKGKSLRMYIFSAPYSINDLCITYFERFTNFVLVAQVRDSFLSRNEVACRTEGWFKKLWEEERILIVEGGFATEGGMEFRENEGQQKWLFIFSNKKNVSELIKPTRKYRISGWPFMPTVKADNYTYYKRKGKRKLQKQVSSNTLP